jgi:ribonuclease VapC
VVIATSALIAIFLAEPERKQLVDSILQDGIRLISAANALETGVVLEAKRGEAAGREFDLFLARADLQLIPVDLEQVDLARSAWRRYGKGRHGRL